VTYQPQTATDLMDWSNVGDPLAGTGNPLSFTFATGPDPKRFFRVSAVR